MILDDDLSSVEAMSAELGIDQDEVRVMLQDLLTQGGLKGRITQDGKRFFREDVRVSDKPAIPRQEEEPAFLRFNTKPARYVAEAGLVILVASYATLILMRGNAGLESIAILAMVLGLGLLLGGCYYIGLRKTP